MTLCSRLRALVRRWRRPASWERALDDELQTYVDHAIDARIATGMTPAEARRTALADLGGVEQVKEHVRAGATGAWLDTLGQDVRYACRVLKSSRGYAIWITGSLAIGVAVTIAALALLNALLVVPFPEVTEQNRLVRVAMSRNCGRPDSFTPPREERAAGAPDCWVRMSAPADYDALRDGLTGAQGLAAYTIGDIAVALPDARSMRSVLASANYFDVLGVRPAVGRMFTPADAETDVPVAVIAYSVWTREFAADPSVIGRSIRVADQFVQIVGVAPPLFAGIDRDRPGGPRRISIGRGADIWLPMSLAERVLPRTAAEQRRQERDFYFVGRLRDRIDVPQLQAEAAVLARRLAASRGEGSAGGRAEVLPLWRVNPRHWHLGVIVVMPIPILILVIACVNAANLMLARGSQRQREMAVRLAIGAGRGRIIRQLLIESAVLAFLGTAVALPIASWGLQLAGSQLGVPIPFDPTVLALTVLTAAATTVAFGLAPAVRLSAQQPSTMLGPVGSRSDATPRQSRMRRALVVAQVALSLGLLASGSQLVATVRSQAVSGGTPADRLLIARFDLRPLRLAAGETERFYRDLLAGASRLPGAEAGGLARHTAVWTFGQGAAPGSIVVWRPDDGPNDGHVTIGGYAGGELFEAVGLRILAGRGFTDADRQLRPQVALVNETAAKRMNGPVLGSSLRVAPRNDWKGGDPCTPPGSLRCAGDLGPLHSARRAFDSSIEVRVVGIIEPAVEPRLEQDEAPAAKIYLPSPVEPEPALALYLRTHGKATTLAQPIRELVHRIAPQLPLQELGSLEELNERSYATPLWLARAAAYLGVIGLVLATAGLYGVSSYVVAMRSREIAIRMAVGARPRVILAMILGQSMRAAVIGLLLGGAAAVVVSRLIQAGYHGIHGIDFAAFGGSAVLFLAAMLLASAIPAVRASRMDPVERLKDG